MTRTEREFTVRTPGRVSLVNVTRELEEAVRGSDVASGLACAFVPHTTCALIVNEDEPGLREDVLRLVGRVVEPLRREAPFAHDRVDDNAAAHLAAILLQPSVVIPVSGGRPALGSWQSLFVVEMDGPRSRTLRVTVVAAGE
jgi:secondary thiamine-phosphate synthase enzyme